MVPTGQTVWNDVERAAIRNLLTILNIVNQRIRSDTQIDMLWGTRFVTAIRDALTILDLAVAHTQKKGQARLNDTELAGVRVVSHLLRSAIHDWQPMAHTSRSVEGLRSLAQSIRLLEILVTNEETQRKGDCDVGWTQGKSLLEAFMEADTE